MQGTDAKSFEYLGGPYSRDKNNIYRQEKIINGADQKTFEMINSVISKDKNNVYYKDLIINGADSQTFEVLECGKKVKPRLLESKSEVIKCLVEYTDKNYIYENFTIEDGELTVTKKKR